MIKKKKKITKRLQMSYGVFPKSLEKHAVFKN